MDPLTVTVSVASFLANSLTTVKILSSLSSRFQHVLVTISSIVSETTILGSYLAHVQQLLLINAPGVTDIGPAGRELRRIFETALTASVTTFACLEEEVRQLAVQTPPGVGPEWKERSKRLWKDDVMEEVLGQIRDQQATMALLVQALQMQSLSASNHFLKENRALLVATMNRAHSLHEAYFPNLKVPDSIFSGQRTALLDGITVGDHEFDFDDDVVNSTVYKRAMANVQRQQSIRGKIRYPPDQVEAEPDSESVDRVRQDVADLSIRNESRTSAHRKLTMETVQESEYEGHSPKRNSQRDADRNSHPSEGRSSRQTRSSSDRSHMVTPDAFRSSSGTLDTFSSYRSLHMSTDSSIRSPDASTTDVSGQIVNFSRKPAFSDAAMMHQTESMDDFYDDSSSILHLSFDDKETLQPMPTSKFGPNTARRAEPSPQDAYVRRGPVPYKAAMHLGMNERSSSKLSHIEEHASLERPESSTSGGSGSSTTKRRTIPSRSMTELGRTQSLDFSQSWSTFWRLTSDEIRKPPYGYIVSLQEMWWRLLQLEESYHNSLKVLYALLASPDMSLPPCSITPAAIQKLQAAHDKTLRQPLRAAMDMGPWTFDYQAIIKAYQSSHGQLMQLYERYSWDLPMVTFHVAAAAVPGSPSSRDLLLSASPGLPTRFTCLRSPLTHVCTTFDVIQSLHDAMFSGEQRGAVNYTQALVPVKEQLRAVIASCNRNVLLRWDEIRRTSLTGSHASRDISVVAQELVFPASQRRNVPMLNLNSPTRAVISRADLFWKLQPGGNFSKSHAILLNNYLILASVFDSKRGQRVHQVYHLVSLAEIATTAMSADASDDKTMLKKAKSGKPVYNLCVRTHEFEHVLGFTSMVHCLEWHEHLDVALRGEMMQMPTGLITET